MSNIQLPFDIESLEITGQEVDSTGIIILDVRSKNKHSTCHKCGEKATKRYSLAPIITVQHTSILDRPVYLRIKPIRYQCEYCDDNTTTTEQYDWCDRNAKVTHALEKYIMRSLVNSTVQGVCTKTQISYKTIVSALDRSVHKTVDWDLYQSLATLGIDDISIKKGHQDFVTVVSTKQDDGGVSVLSVFEGRDKADVISFLNSIPLHLRKTVTTVCTDMYEGYANAAVEVFGKQSIVIDRYHVAKQYRKPLDALRISELKRLKSLLSQDDYSKLEGVMWILRKKHECLSTEDKEKLQLLYEYSPELKEAHKMAMKLTNIFNTHQNRKSGLKKLNGWILAVHKSEVTCFNRFIATLERHKSGIANYFKNRKNSGFVEGLNNKIKLTKRRCYGFFKVESLFKRLQLDCNGFRLFAL